MTSVAALPGNLESPPEWISYVMKHIDAKQCAHLSVLSKQWHSDLSTSCSYWRQLCVKLAEERKLYLNLEPFDAKASLATWKSVFRELWEIRNQFVEEEEEEGDAVQPEGETGSEKNDKVFRNETERTRGLEGRLRSLIERSQMSREERERLDEEDQKGKTFSIGVCVRFKPTSRRSSALEESQRGATKGITLPLHQRLPLIKAKYGKNLSNSEAMKKIMMMEYGMSSGPRDPWAGAYIQEDQNQKENQPSPEVQKQKQQMVGEANKVGGSGSMGAGIMAIKEEEASVLALVPGTGLREFKFDKVFESNSSNPSVHLKSSQRVVGDFINGFNGTVMVYGQTGSGKTYTMFGKQTDIVEDNDEDGESTTTRRRPASYAGGVEEEGIAQMTCREVLSAVKEREESAGIEWRLAVTYVEIYGQDVYDLLKGGQMVGQSRVAGQRYVLDGQTEWPVNSWGEIQTYLEIGSRQKRKACTAMNERSSRAHTVFILSLTQKVGQNQNETAAAAATSEMKQVTSKLMLVDLGGSEKLSKSRVHENVKGAGTVKWETYYEQRKHLTEALYINTGLFALKACIEALHEKQEQERMHREDPSFKKKHIYVPYQDSKLTMILSSSLGGNARTVMIVTASKDNYNALETFQSLRFGEQCSSVKNTALCMSKASLINAINDLDRKIKACEDLVKKHERWETKKVIRKDVERDEIVTVTVPVGAELYRKELEKLLQRKETLLGGSPESEPELSLVNMPPNNAQTAVA